jgi:hypothetical protein
MGDKPTTAKEIAAMLAASRPPPVDPFAHGHNAFVSLVSFYGAALAEANARCELAGREVKRLEAQCLELEATCRERAGTALRTE